MDHPTCGHEGGMGRLGMAALAANVALGCTAGPDRGAAGFGDDGGTGIGQGVEGSDSAPPGDGGQSRLDIPDGTMGTNGGDEPTGCKAVDFLFVIDSSGSMQDEQASLIASFSGFISGIEDQLTWQSYHVGVIASDAYVGNDAQCQELGALVTATAGENSSDAVCGPFTEGRYMTRDDDLVGGFSCAAKIGTVGSGNEQPMRALEAAIGDELAAPGGCNEGFLRSEALLVVVLITDEEDDREIDGCGNPFGGNGGSDGDPFTWYDSVVRAKGAVPERVVALSLIGPPGPDPSVCPPLDKCADAILGAEPSERLSEFTLRFPRGRVGRVCDPMYSDFFADAVAEIVEACDEFPPEE